MQKKNQKSRFNFWEFFQSLGKTFMLPIALLGISGMMLGVGGAFTSSNLLEKIPFLTNEYLQLFFMYVKTLGLFTFKFLPVLFAVAIPLGLAREDKEIAAFAGLVGYIVMNTTMNFYMTEANMLATPEDMKLQGQAMILGLQVFDTGVLGGIFSGIIVHALHKKFIDIELSDGFAFFAGPRFVPIITTVVMGIVGLIVPIIWPYFYSGITLLGDVINGAGPAGPFIYGASERLLLPFGLHHILTAMVRFTPIGGEALVNGETVTGAMNIFYAFLDNGMAITPELAGMLEQGRTLPFFFGLPAMALAVYHTAKSENKKAIKGLLISGCVAAIVGGITEPLEFIFLFISPPLYIFHALMTGLSYMILPLIGVTMGSVGDIIGVFIFGILQGAQTKWFLIIPAGILWGAAYYFVFRWAIVKFNLKTPGREDEAINIQGSNDKQAMATYRGQQMLHALGGMENIVSIDNCATRLRLVVKDADLVDEIKVKEVGAIGIVKLDKTNVQVIIGPQVNSMRKQIQKAMAVA